MKNPIFLFILLLLYSCTSKKEAGKSQKGNHLVNETSAYLLQHAHNPVDWYPWSQPALDLAAKERKLMVISIGYSSCHWCHVMERESFSDTAVSRLMNEHFVSIKVDREERPDIDNVYMTACQVANPGGSCGWPLNAITLPDGRPVWVGTYLSRDEWMQLLRQIHDLYQEDENSLLKMAYQIENHLQVDHRFTLSENDIRFDPKLRDQYHAQVLASLDMKRGGKNGDLKFPLPALVQYGMQYAQYSADAKTKQWVHTTLDRMMNGGIYDHLSGGFARYSTDPEWKVPHFEKMLYDNAQLVSLYANAYKWNRSAAYKDRLEHSLKFIYQSFSSQQGFYFSSFDAETEGEEGKYYVWTLDEIKQIITDPVEQSLLVEHYDIRAEGNWKKGKNVLAVMVPVPVLAKSKKMTEGEVQSKLESARVKLLEARQKRTAPRRDEKVIAAWNAMMTTAWCDAYAATGDPADLEQALKTANFIKTQMIGSDHRLYRTYVNGRKGEYAFLDDYALTIQSFIRLYEVSFDEGWLHAAKNLCDYVIPYFSDEEQVYFYYNSSQDPKLIVRKKELADQVMPSSNSVMCDVLHRLGLYFYDEAYLKRSKSMLAGVLDGPASKDPVFYSNWLRLQLEQIRPLYEVAIVGPDYKKLQQELLAVYAPQAILLGGATEGGLELLKEKLQDGSTYIYVCRNKVCKLPVTDVRNALDLMD
ncbi:MAG TPA: thioredoxin domain-containing protein [Saprospiraceae bacterium]|nr:thioredoxin domain-containing protein [Saprospiraceae bacterium]